MPNLLVTSHTISIIYTLLVPEYEITHPVLSDIEREFLGSSGTKPRIRERRNIADEETGTRYYTLKAFGLNFYLNVTRSNVLASSFVVESRHKNKSRIISTPETPDHFIGNVVSYPGSFVSLSVGTGLVWHIVILYSCRY